ncbi:MAG: DUF389 domain-containing protein, partial [Actinomycetota bacterium]|nr:DUF389 domain-containing protein [Actinomycetota bacterium]
MRVTRALTGAGEPWRLRFSSMLLLSVVIAVAGLLADSAALVIGAMLIAPLMTPVLAFAMALGMGWPRHLARAGLTVVVASIGSVAVAWALAALLRGSASVVTPQILGRTSPGMVDLVVALAAGAAGGYATVREDISAALPGVAVAVALVPPLASVGVALELGRAELAQGALLLYVANLVAIVAAAVVVFVTSGFVPTPRLAQIRGRVLISGMAVVAAVAAVSVPLSRGVRSTVDSATTLKAVNAKVLAWLGTDKSLKVRHVAVRGNRVTVDVTGTSRPPPGSALASALVDVLGQNASAQVRWTQG